MASARDADKELLAATLMDIGAIKFGAFRLKLHEKKPDAPLSPIYVNLRLLRSFPHAMDLAVDALAALSAGVVCDLYADVPTAATPLVALLSNRTRIPMISPRPEAKSHGLSGNIDGVYQAGQRVVLVDDLITQADSKLEAIHVLEAGQLVVRDVLVLVDREQGGSETLAQLGYTLHTWITLRELLGLYRSAGQIDETTYTQTMDYLLTPM